MGISSDGIVLPFLAAGGMWSLLVGVLLLWKYSERNLQQRLLMGAAIVWFSYGAWFITRHYFIGIDFSNRIIALDRIIWGMVMALITVAYPITAICREWLRTRIFKGFIVFPFLLVSAYFGYSLISGKGFEEYNSYAALSGHWTNPVVVLRITILAISLLYNLIALFLIVKVFPVYQRYVKNTYSNLEYNLRWIRVVVVFFSFNTLVYALNVFWYDWWTRLLFMVVNFPSWVFMIEQGVFRKGFSPAADFTIRWSWKKGWYEVYYTVDTGGGQDSIGTSFPIYKDTSLHHEFEQVDVEISAKNDFSRYDITGRMEKYMGGDLPFTDSNLTRDTFAKAVGTNRTTLLLAVKQLGYASFQDYVNSYRIFYFKSLAIKNPDAPISELFQQSGFATKSTFYRYFKEAEGMLPSEYMQTISKTLDIRS